jgi:hypothetical protein
MISELDPELEAWIKYDEESEIHAVLSVDERLEEFDDMLNSVASFKEIWEGREFTIPVYKTSSDIYQTYRWEIPF